MTVTLGATQFEVRSGVFGTTQADFNPAGVKQMSGGKVRLSLTKENGAWRSAGLLGPVMEAGKTYELEILGRLDVLDPRMCFAVWGNGPNGEVDFLEACRWGDPFNPLYTSAWHQDGVAYAGETRPSTACSSHRVIVTPDMDALIAIIEGRWDGNRVALGMWELPFFEGMRFKVALWVPKTGPLYAAARDRGPLYVDVKEFAVTP